MLEGLIYVLELLNDRIASVGNEGPLWRELCDLKRDITAKADKEMEDMAAAMAPEHNTEGMNLDAHGCEDTSVPQKEE